jgi:serine/threonine protein kinase
LSDDYSQSLRDLVDKCLNTDPESRPNIEEVLRYPLVRTELDNILKDFLSLTYDYLTAMSTHLILEQVIDIQCMLAKSSDDNGIPITDPSIFRVANTRKTKSLMQSELRAIKSGLQYKEIQDSSGTYKGYVDKDGKKEGVGIFIKSDGVKYYGEWHLNNEYGFGIKEFGNKGWGIDYNRFDQKKRYGTWEGTKGNR